MRIVRKQDATAFLAFELLSKTIHMTLYKGDSDSGYNRCLGETVQNIILLLTSTVSARRH